MIAQGNAPGNRLLQIFILGLVLAVTGCADLWPSPEEDSRPWASLARPGPQHLSPEEEKAQGFIDSLGYLAYLIGSAVH
jgi:hypothetical protein